MGSILVGCSPENGIACCRPWSVVHVGVNFTLFNLRAHTTSCLHALHTLFGRFSTRRYPRRFKMQPVNLFFQQRKRVLYFLLPFLKLWNFLVFYPRSNYAHCLVHLLCFTNMCLLYYILGDIFIFVNPICCLFKCLVFSFLLSCLCIPSYRRKILVKNHKVVVLRYEFAQAVVFFQEAK